MDDLLQMNSDLTPNFLRKRAEKQPWSYLLLSGNPVLTYGVLSLEEWDSAVMWGPAGKLYSWRLILSDWLPWHRPRRHSWACLWGRSHGEQCLREQLALNVDSNLHRLEAELEWEQRTKPASWASLKQSICGCFRGLRTSDASCFCPRHGLSTSSQPGSF